MAAPTTNAKRGGEWETAENAGCQEVERLSKKPSTRLNSKKIATEEEELAIVRGKLYQQHCRWERCVGAMHFGGLAKYEEYTAAMRTARDNKASPDQVAKAKAVVARLERDKKENQAANGEESHRKRKADDPVKYSEDQAAAGKGTQGTQISSSGGRRGPGGRGENIDISSLRRSIGTFPRAYKKEDGTVVAPKGKSEFFIYHHIPDVNGGADTLGMHQYDSHGKVLTLCYPSDAAGKEIAKTVRITNRLANKQTGYRRKERGSSVAREQGWSEVIGNWIRGGVGECEEVYGRESDFYIMYKFKP